MLAFRRPPASTLRDDGYTLNRLTGDRGNNTDRGSARFSLSWTPSETFDGQFQFRYGKSNGGSIWAYNRSLLPATPAATGPDGLCAPGFYTSGQCTDLAGYSNTSTNLYQGDYHLEGKRQGRDLRRVIDPYLESGRHVAGLGHGLRSCSPQRSRRHRRWPQRHHQCALPRPSKWAASEELRLQSNGDNKLNWVAGLYYARDDLWSSSFYDVFRIANSGNPAIDEPQGIGVFSWPFTQKTSSYAAFGQIDYKITDRLTATVGLRYSADDKSFVYDSLYSSDIGGPGQRRSRSAMQMAISSSMATAILFSSPRNTSASKTFSSTSGRLGLQYRFTDDVNLYVSYNRGYKKKRQLLRRADCPYLSSLKPYDDESVNAYEGRREVPASSASC